MFELDLVGKPPLVNPLEDDCSVKIVVPKPPNCQYNLCLKDLPPVTFLHINIGISQRDWIYGGRRDIQQAVNLGWGNTGIRWSLVGEGTFTTSQVDHYLMITTRKVMKFFCIKEHFLSSKAPRIFYSIFQFFLSIFSIHFYSFLFETFH